VAVAQLAVGDGTSGSTTRAREIFSVGAITSAMPSITLRPSWFTARQSKMMWWLCSNFSLQVTVIVSVSPIVIGRQKFRPCDTYTVPGPGNSVPSTVEISVLPHMLWPTTSRNWLERAYSRSTWVGLTSPDMAAKRWMSSGRSVRTSWAKSPTWISSKVRFWIIACAAGAFMATLVLGCIATRDSRPCM